MNEHVADLQVIGIKRTNKTLKDHFLYSALHNSSRREINCALPQYNSMTLSKTNLKTEFFVRIGVLYFLSPSPNTKY